MFYDPSQPTNSPEISPSQEKVVPLLGSSSSKTSPPLINFKIKTSRVGGASNRLVTIGSGSTEEESENSLKTPNAAFSENGVIVRPLTVKGDTGSVSSEEPSHDEADKQEIIAVLPEVNNERKKSRSRSERRTEKTRHKKSYSRSRSRSRKRDRSRSRKRSRERRRKSSRSPRTEKKRKRDPERIEKSHPKSDRDDRMHDENRKSKSKKDGRSDHVERKRSSSRTEDRKSKKTKHRRRSSDHKNDAATLNPVSFEEVSDNNEWADAAPKPSRKSKHSKKQEDNDDTKAFKAKVTNEIISARMEKFRKHVLEKVEPESVICQTEVGRKSHKKKRRSSVEVKTEESKDEIVDAEKDNSEEIPQLQVQMDKSNSTCEQLSNSDSNVVHNDKKKENSSKENNKIESTNKDEDKSLLEDISFDETFLTKSEVSYSDSFELRKEDKIQTTDQEKKEVVTSNVHFVPKQVKKKQEKLELDAEKVTEQPDTSEDLITPEDDNRIPESKNLENKDKHEKENPIVQVSDLQISSDNRTEKIPKTEKLEDEEKSKNQIDRSNDRNEKSKHEKPQERKHSKSEKHKKRKDSSRPRKRSSKRESPRRKRKRSTSRSPEKRKRDRPSRSRSRRRVSKSKSNSRDNSRDINRSRLRSRSNSRRRSRLDDRPKRSRRDSRTRHGSQSPIKSGVSSPRSKPPVEKRRLQESTNPKDNDYKNPINALLLENVSSKDTLDTTGDLNVEKFSDVPQQNEKSKPIDEKMLSKEHHEDPQWTAVSDFFSENLPTEPKKDSNIENKSINPIAPISNTQSFDFPLGNLPTVVNDDFTGLKVKKIVDEKVQCWSDLKKSSINQWLDSSSNDAPVKNPPPNSMANPLPLVPPVQASMPPIPMPPNFQEFIKQQILPKSGGQLPFPLPPFIPSFIPPPPFLPPNLENSSNLPSVKPPPLLPEIPANTATPNDKSIDNQTSFNKPTSFNNLPNMIYKTSFDSQPSFTSQNSFLNQTGFNNFNNLNSSQTPAVINNQPGFNIFKPPTVVTSNVPEPSTPLNNSATPISVNRSQTPTKDEINTTIQDQKDCEATTPIKDDSQSAINESQSAGFEQLVQSILPSPTTPVVLPKSLTVNVEQQKDIPPPQPQGPTPPQSKPPERESSPPRPSPSYSPSLSPMANKCPDAEEAEEEEQQNSSENEVEEKEAKLKSVNNMQGTLQNLQELLSNIKGDSANTLNESHDNSKFDLTQEDTVLPIGVAVNEFTPPRLNDDDNDENEITPSTTDKLRDLEKLFPPPPGSTSSSASPFKKPQQKQPAPAPVLSKTDQKKQMQERVASLAKKYLKPFYTKNKISKTQYKHIMRRVVNKCTEGVRKNEVKAEKVKKLVASYVSHMQAKGH
ncbi:uncharacterized protein LOC142337524 isoform X2 [Convolutriloba macropyga]|uniref:uncharacterized protein LOC142337524 isoform X2 n=1 Tax=Convolutriloba macropyga TaxID=536237 RepID=UPI003F51F50D